MYYYRPERKRRSSPVRVLILLVLIGGVLYVVTQRPELVTSHFVPTPTPTRSLASYLDEAEALYLRGELDDAIHLYEKAAGLDPDNTTIYVRWSRLLAIRHLTAEAVQRAQEAASKLENAKTLAALCMALDWDGQYAEALKKCQTAIQLDPEYAEAHAYLAEVYADLVSWDRALEEAELAVSLDDTSVDAHRNLGYVLEKQGRYHNAISEYERAIELQPKLGYLYIGLGRNYLVLADYDSAVEQFQKAIQVDTDNVEGYDLLGWAYFAEGDYGLAATQLETAIEVNPEYALAYGHLGVTYYVQRNYEAAIPTLKKAIELGLDSVEYYYELGLSYVYLDQCEEAIPWLEQAWYVDQTALPAYQGMVLCGEWEPLPTATPTVTPTAESP